VRIENVPEILVLEDKLGELGGGDPDEVHEQEYQQTHNKPPQSRARTRMVNITFDRAFLRVIFLTKTQNSFLGKRISKKYELKRGAGVKTMRENKN
jgi:hypothetical protein